MQNNNDKNPYNDPLFNKNSASSMKSETGAMSITSKNLSIIEDQANYEAMAYKKCSLYSEYFSDQTLKNMANAAAQHHRAHFDALQSYLNSHQ